MNDEQYPRLPQLQKKEEEEDSVRTPAPGQPEGSPVYMVTREEFNNEQLEKANDPLAWHYKKARQEVDAMRSGIGQPVSRSQNSLAWHYNEARRQVDNLRAASGGQRVSRDPRYDYRESDDLREYTRVNPYTAGLQNLDPEDLEVLEKQGIRLTQQMGALGDGTLGVDLRAAANDIAKARYDQQVENRQISGERPFTRVEARKTYLDELDAAAKKLTRARAQASGVPLPMIDTDPTGTQLELEQYAEDYGWFGKATVPIAAWMSPYMHDVYQTTAEGGQTIEAKQHGGLDWLAWFGQGAPSTYVATALEKDGQERGVGSPEQIRAIREGEDLFDRLPELGRLNPWYQGAEALGLVDAESEEFWQTVSGVPLGLGIVMLEPDAFSVATLGLGKVYRVGKGVAASASAVATAAKLGQTGLGDVARRTYRTGASMSEGRNAVIADVVTDIANRIPANSDKPLDVIRDTQAQLRAISPAMAEAVEFQMQVATGNNTQVSALTAELLNAHEAAWRRYDYSVREAASVPADKTPAGVTRLQQADQYDLNAPVVPVAVPGTTYSTSMSKKNLVAAAQTQGIRVTTRMNKTALANALNKATPVVDVPQAEKLAEELRVVETRALASTSMAQDLIALKQTVRRLGNTFRGGGATSAQRAGMEARVADSYRTMRQAQEQMLGATGAQLRQAQRALAKAQTDFRTLMRTMAKTVGADAEKLLDNAILGFSDDATKALTRREAMLVELRATERAGAWPSPALGTVMNPKRLQRFERSLKQIKETTNAGARARNLMVLDQYKAAVVAVGASYKGLAQLQARGASKAPSVSSILLPLREEMRAGGTVGLVDVGRKLARSIPSGLLEKFAESGLEGSDLARDIINATMSLVPTNITLDVNNLRRLTALAENIKPMFKTHAIEESGSALAQMVELRQRTLPFGEVSFVQATVNKIADSVSGVLRPADRALGAGDLQQIGKGMLDGISLLQYETTNLVRRGTPDEIVDKLYKFMDEKEAGIMSGANGLSLAAEGFGYLRRLDDVAASQDKLIEGFSRMWVPGGYPTLDQFGSNLHNAAVNIIRYGDAKAPASGDRQAARLAAAALTFEEMTNLMLEYTSSLLGRRVVYTPDALRASEGVRGVGFASQLIGQAALYGRASRAARQQLVGISDEALNAAASLTNTGAVGRQGFDDFHTIAEVFARSGIPPRLKKQAVLGSQELIGGLEVIMKDDLFSAGVMPRRWQAASEARMGKIIKELEAFAVVAANPEERLWSIHAAGIYRLWQRGLTTGVILPKARYFANMLFGNFAQIWAEDGLVSALSNASQQIFANVDGVTGWASMKVGGYGSTKLQRMRQKAFDEAQGRIGSGTLPSVTDALLNPYVSAVYDPAIMPNAKRIHKSTGEVITAGELREALRQQGVLTSMARQGIGSATERSGNLALRSTTTPVSNWMNSIKDTSIAFQKRIGGWVDDVADVADLAEQRQRVALFTDAVINRGMSYEEAGDLVRRSLYDWGHATWKAERGFIEKVTLFYRFWRLALGQGARLLSEPFVRGAADDGGSFLANAITSGRSSGQRFGTSKVRDLNSFIRAGQEVGATTQEQGEADDATWMLRQIYPWWSSRTGRPFLTNEPLSAEEAAWVLATRGDDASYVATSYPAATPVDTFSLLFSAAGMVAGTVAGQVGPLQGARWGVETAVGFMPEPVGEAVEGLANYFYADITKFPGNGLKLKSPTERMLLGEERKGSRAQTPDDPEVRRAREIHVRLFRLSPVFGTELGYWLDPAMMAMDESNPMGIRESLTWMLQQYTGVGMNSYHDPATTQSNRGKYQVGTVRSDEIRRAKNVMLDEDE